MADEKNNFLKEHAVSKDATRMVTVNGVRLAYEIYGTGDIPLVMVHGGFESLRAWDLVVPHLADSFRVLIYDQRGYGESEQRSGQSGIREHVGDLAALIEHLGLGPAWVVGQSQSCNIVLRLAAERPDLLRGIIAHEPTLPSLLADDPATSPLIEGLPQLLATVSERLASGDHAGAAEQFVEEGLGEGLWAKFPPWFRQMVIENTPTSLDEANDPDLFAFDLEWIRGFTRPALLTLGDQTAPMFPLIITRLAEAMPSVEVQKFTGAGHPIMVEQPKNFAEAINDFVRRHTK
jgi:pimeloyl-ACP methyl ester carboxylesterase